MAQVYDTIGVGYAERRRPDPRIADAINAALADARTVVNVGAGAGSYEPDDRSVMAVEPSLEMVRQRPPGSAPVARAVAADLPFGDRAFDAALAILTIHHWPDPARGLAELARVAGRVVLVTFDPDCRELWIIHDYFPKIAELDHRMLPPIDEVCAALGGAAVHPMPVPHDCIDGFLGAYWRRPHAYLDASVRRAISGFAILDDVEPGLARLRRDLEDGTWERRHGHLRERAELDVGYRIVVADGHAT